MNKFTTSFIMFKKGNKFQFGLIEPVVISVFWILLFISPILFKEKENGINWTHILNTWKSLLPYLTLSLLNRFILLPYLFFKNKKIVFVVLNIALIAILAVNIRAYNNWRINGQDLEPQRRPAIEQPRPFPPEHALRNPQAFPINPNEMPPPRQFPPAISFALIAILIVGFDTSLKLSVKWFQMEQNRIKSEKENIETQLAFLRNQISPHFFMNTLNNIHSLIDYDKEEAKDSIIRLSKLMRHLLYDSESEKIAIQKEFEFIQNYIDLMQLRFGEKIKISLIFPEAIPNKSIPPLLFTSFVENAFKHGISYQSESFITINFESTVDSLIFNIKNSIPEIKKEETLSGIGIGNSRKRLDLIYGDNYTLNIKESDHIYNVSLTIPI